MHPCSGGGVHPTRGGGVQEEGGVLPHNGDLAHFGGGLTKGLTSDGVGYIISAL